MKIPDENQKTKCNNLDGNLGNRFLSTQIVFFHFSFFLFTLFRLHYFTFHIHSQQINIWIQKVIYLQLCIYDMDSHTEAWRISHSNSQVKKLIKMLFLEKKTVDQTFLNVMLKMLILLVLKRVEKNSSSTFNLIHIVFFWLISLYFIQTIFQTKPVSNQASASSCSLLTDHNSFIKATALGSPLFLQSYCGIVSYL